MVRRDPDAGRRLPVRPVRPPGTGPLPARSLDNRNVHAMVQTEMVPLLPDRSLEVHQDGDGLHLTLSRLAAKAPTRTGSPQPSNDATLWTPPVAPVDLTVLTGTLPDFSGLGTRPPSDRHWADQPAPSPYRPDRARTRRGP
jgi:hypothetical protein